MLPTKKIYCLFVDDSGSQCPDRNQAPRIDGIDVYALGGILIEETAIEGVKSLHKQLMIKHELECPNDSFAKVNLHSTKIRCKKDDFKWLENNPQKAASFHHDLSELIISIPIVGHACIVDRSNYHQRFAGIKNKWEIGRSAYQILIERAVKFVRSNGGTKLKIYVEKTGKKEDKLIQSYHERIRTEGMEFDPKNSSIYSPINNEEISNFLLKNVEFGTKDNRMLQLADLVLYPLIKGYFDKKYPPYQALLKNNKIIDCLVQDPKKEGVKYYCFPTL